GRTKSGRGIRQDAGPRSDVWKFSQGHGGRSDLEFGEGRLRGLSNCAAAGEDRQRSSASCGWTARRNSSKNSRLYGQTRRSPCRSEKSSRSTDQPVRRQIGSQSRATDHKRADLGLPLSAVEFQLVVVPGCNTIDRNG